jgi:ligand-binding sensor domain-containing protein/signal transduction histidine kinase
MYGTGMDRFYHIVFFFLMLNFPLWAQISINEDPYTRFEKLAVKDGLSNNYILDICQDAEGFIWIATQHGLNRYDGFEILNFYHSPEDTLSISNNLVTCLEIDNEGNLWAGSSFGLNRFDKHNNKFERYYFADTTVTNHPGNHIRALLADPSGVLWVETADGYLNKFDLLSHQTERFKHTPPSMINTYFYHTIYQEPKTKHLWLGGRYMGIFRFNAENGEFYQVRENPNDKNKKRDNDVAAYFEDSSGQFWISGIDGLYKFDRETEIFGKILPVSTFTIQEDRKGSLWIGTGDGIYILEHNTGRFRHVKHNDNNAESLIHNHVNKIFIDLSGNVWIGTLDGISIFSQSKNKFRHIYHVPENDNTPISNHITCLLEDNQNRIWIGTSNNGLECFDENFNKILSYNTISDAPFKLVSDKISTLMEDQDGDIWIGLWAGRGFHIINPDHKTNRHFQLHKTSLQADWYNDFLEDSKGRCWVGIWGAQGLYNFDKDNGKFTNNRYIQIYHTLDSPVLDMAHDGKYIWPVLKYQNRFFCLDPTNFKFTTYSKDFYASFEFNRVLNVNSDRNGKVWFETNKGNFLKLNNPYFSFIEYSEPPPQNNHNPDKTNLEKILGKTVLSSVKDAFGKHWAGTFEGLYQIKDNEILANFRYDGSKNAGLINDTVWSLFYYPPNELWIGTNRGICKLDIIEKLFVSYNEPLSLYLSSHLVSTVLEDNDGFIWIGTTNNSLNRLNPESGYIEQFPNDLSDSLSFWGEGVSCIFQDAEGSIWIGGKGLNKYNPEQNTFSHFTEENGLARNEIMGMLEDQYGYLWISTKSGLSRMDPVNHTFENFFEKDGLQENEFSRATVRLHNGLLLFGGKNGISVVDPGNIDKNQTSPPLAITGFKLFDKDMDITFYDHPEIKLNFDENNFSFEFTALDFSDPERNTYSYILENFDTDWHFTTGTDRVARYTNVDPGSYTFRVKAANVDGTWNETGIFIPVVIKPPFWKTAWFYGLEILLGVSIIILIIKYREKKIKEQNRYLMLEQKLLRSQMNPHFIFNSLSSIQSYIFESNPVEAGSYLSRFAELIRSILYNSREEFIPLEKEIKTLENYLDLQKLRYDNKFDYEIDVDPKLDKESIAIPPMMAQPFIENAIEHGIKHLEEPGFINISFTQMDETILFIVEDNGIGIKAARNINSHKAKEHQSLATVIARERIEILNKGRRKKLYYMEIKETTDQDGDVSGTQVKFVIPFTKT